jgi:hypothetical protein
MNGPVYIRIDRPEEYDDYADELLIEDWIACLNKGAVSAETGGFDWQQVDAPVEITDEITDEMVEAACEAHTREWAEIDGSKYDPLDIDDDARSAMRAALRAAMGIGGGR